MISIITTVYNNDLFLKDALDSFIESCGKNKFEILVGIDNCKTSLKHILDLYPNLNKNIKVFYFVEKVGTYIIRNTLSTIAKYDNLIFFDSDDVMRNQTVTNTIKTLNGGHDIYRFGYIPFSGNLSLSKSGVLNTKFTHHVGAFGIKKKVFLEMKGFEPWICAADGEFIWRINANGYKQSLSKDIDIFYRRHTNNLTINPLTGMNSPLRKSYHIKKEFKIKNDIKNPLDKLEVSLYTIVDDIFYKKYSNSDLKSFEQINKKISIIIPTFNTPIFLKECLKSIIESVERLNVEILVGIDGCKNTLESLKNESFDSRIKFYFFEENVGPYIIKNTLSEISNSDILLFFDSDDIMLKNLITDTLEVLSLHKMYKPMYYDFNDLSQVKNIEKLNTKVFGEGVFAIDKNTFMSLNGFEGWKCAADSDFAKRFFKRKYPFVYGQKVAFLRRIHSNSLTQHPETNMTSKIRSHYFTLSKKERPNQVCENFVTHSCKLIPTQSNNTNSLLVILDFEKEMVYRNEYRLGKEKVDSVISKLNLKPKKETTNGVDYDKLNKVLHDRGVYDPQKNLEKKKVVQNIPDNRNQLIQLKKDSNLDALKKNLPGKPYRRKDAPNINSKKKYGG